MSWTDNTAWDAALEADPRIAIGDGFGPLDPDARKSKSTKVLYRPGELLVARDGGDADDDRLRSELDGIARSLRADARSERESRRADVADRLGLDLVHLDDRDPLGLLRDLRRARIVPKRASVVHFLVASPQRHGGDSPPEQVVPDEVFTAEAGVAEVSETIRIGVLDTGIVEPQPFGYNKGGWGDLDVVTPHPPGPYDVGVGHGTLVAGVIARHAPGATLEIRRVLENPGGVADELDIAESLEAIAGENFDFVNASFSGFSVDDETMLAFDAAVQLLLATDTVIIAAAGNEGLERPAFMAAFEGVVGVASVEGDQNSLQLADYSNFGDHVELCGRGTDVKSTYVTGQAVVSGTSFAAPKATALAARELDAARALDNAAKPRAAVDELINSNLPEVEGGGRFIGL